MKKTALNAAVIFSFSIVFLFKNQVAMATTLPTFPSCINPEGTVKASYDTGVHGIAGDTGEHTGSDTVYSLTDDTVTQCFCPSNGSGIQTDWWKMRSFNEQDIEELKSQGWIFIPDGSAWGLHPASYVARNANYSCLSSNNGGDNGGGEGGNSNSGSSGGSSSSNNTSNSNNSVSLSTALNLASTGNSVFILSYLLLGITAVGLGLYLKK